MLGHQDTESRFCRMDYIDWLNRNYAGKVVTSQKAISTIKKGSRIFIGTGCGEPQHLSQGYGERCKP